MSTAAIIQNQYDGPRAPLRLLEPQEFNLDFAYSDSPQELDDGVRETIRGVKMSIMAMGIALYRLQVAGLYIDLNFRRFGLYVNKLAEDTGMTRANIYNWVYIGEAYIKHRAELEKIGFDDNDGPTKLPFLGRALENHNKREVFRAVKEMSKREFQVWAKGEPIQDSRSYKAVKVKGDQVFIGSKPVIAFADGISPDERRYYERIILEAARAREDQEAVGFYRFYDESERRRFDRVYDRELKDMRTKK
jgi:hypothetical protein